MDTLNWDHHIDALLSTLSDLKLGDNVDLIREFPSRIKDNPLKKITVAYGVKELSAYYPNEDAVRIVFDVTLDFTIHAPITSSGAECHSVFLKIIEYIYQNIPTLINFGCGELQFNRSNSTLELEGYGVVRILL